MNIDDRAARAKEELDMAFMDTEVPPAAGIRRRHQRRRITQGVVTGIAVAAVAVGLATVVNSESARNDEGIVAETAEASVAQLENSRWTLVESINTGTPLEGGDDVVVTFSAMQTCSELAPGPGPVAGNDGTCSMLVVGGDCVSFVALVEVRAASLVAHEQGTSDPGCIDVGIGSLFESDVAFSIEGDSLTLNGSGGRGVRLQRVPSDVEETTDTSPSGAVPIFGPDTRMVAALTDGRIVELFGSGEVARDILNVEDGKEVGDLQLLDNGDLYFTLTDANSYFGGGKCGRLFRIKSDGSESEPEDVGFDTGTFAISPDGAAVALTGSVCIGGERGTVTIVDFATGERHEWSAPEEGDSGFETNIHPRGLAWSLDSQSLATTWCYEGCFTVLVDPADDGIVSGNVGPDEIVGGDAPAWTAGGLWTMATFYAEEPADRTITRYDPETGARDEQLSPFGPGVQELFADGGGLIAFGYNYDDSTVNLERWDFTTVTSLEIEDPGIEILAVG